MNRYPTPPESALLFICVLCVVVSAVRLFWISGKTEEDLDCLYGKDLRNRRKSILANFWILDFYNNQKNRQKNELEESTAVGLDKGFVTAKRTSKKTRPSRRRGKQNAAIASARQIVREVTYGLTPYLNFFRVHYTHTHTCINTYRLEKRLVDIYKIGIGNPDKRVYKISKKRNTFSNRRFYFFVSFVDTNLSFKNSSELTSVLLRSERELSRSTRICMLLLLQRIKKFFSFCSWRYQARGSGAKLLFYF